MAGQRRPHVGGVGFPQTRRVFDVGVTSQLAVVEPPPRLRCAGRRRVVGVATRAWDVRRGLPLPEVTGWFRRRVPVMLWRRDDVGFGERGFRSPPPGPSRSIDVDLVGAYDLLVDIEASAREHGVSDDDMVHAIRNHWRAFEIDDPAVTMFVGPSLRASPLEIGVVTDDEGSAVIDAMPARGKFLKGSRKP